MAPAAQRLGADHRAAARVVLGLELQRQRVVLDRQPQVAADHAGAAGALAGGAVEQAHLVRAAFAGLGQAHARGLHQRLGGLGVARVDGDADIDPDLHLQPARGDELGQRAQHARAQLLRAAVVHQLGHADGELVARQPGEKIVRLQHGLRERAGVLRQDIVGADLEDLVDLAVVGDMDQQHGAAGIGQPRLGHGLVQPAAERDAVGHHGGDAVLAHRALPARGGAHRQPAGNAGAAPHQPRLGAAHQGGGGIVGKILGGTGLGARYRQPAARLRPVQPEHQRAQRGQPACQPGGMRQAGGVDAGARRGRAGAAGPAQVGAGGGHHAGAGDHRQHRRAAPQARALAQPLQQQLGGSGSGRGGGKAGGHPGGVVGRRHAARQHHHHHGQADGQLRQQRRSPGQRAQRPASGTLVRTPGAGAEGGGHAQQGGEQQQDGTQGNHWAAR
ncbi:hypothetical protein D9M69_215940 [compost metagenome]